MSLTLVHKYTYQAKEEIKRLGGRWNKKQGGWDMPTQEAYDEALKCCEAFCTSVDYNDADAVEDVPGWLKSVDWMFRVDNSISPVSLKENVGKPVVSGLVITGIAYPSQPQSACNEWIVTCKKEDWGVDTFAVVNINTLGCRFMTSNEIRGCVWHGQDLEKAKTMWKKHLERR